MENREAAQHGDEKKTAWVDYVVAHHAGCATNAPPTILPGVIGNTDALANPSYRNAIV